MNFVPTTRLKTGARASLISLIALGLLALAVGLLSAQDSGAGKPQGEHSKDGKSQGKELVQEITGQAMPGSGSEPEVRGDDYQEREAATESPMERAAASTSEEVDDQMPVEQVLGAGQESGADQVPREDFDDSQELFAEATSGEPYLTLLLRISKDGQSEVLSATEIVGVPGESDQALSDFVFAVSDDGAVLGTQALPGNPFEGHSFGGSADSTEGHHFIELDEATVSVRVPNRSLDSELGSLKLDLYQLRSGPEVESFSASALENLRSERRLELVTSVSGVEIARYVREKGVRVDH